MYTYAPKQSTKKTMSVTEFLQCADHLAVAFFSLRRIYDKCAARYQRSNPIMKLMNKTHPEYARGGFEKVRRLLSDEYHQYLTDDEMEWYGDVFTPDNLERRYEGMTSPPTDFNFVPMMIGLSLSEHLGLADDFAIARHHLWELTLLCRGYYPKSSPLMKTLNRIHPGQIGGFFSKACSLLDDEYHRIISHDQFKEHGHVYYELDKRYEEVGDEGSQARSEGVSSSHAVTCDDRPDASAGIGLERRC